MADTMSGIHPKERAFNGAFKSYAIDVGAGEIDLLSVMRAKRSEFDNIVRLNTQLEPKKVHEKLPKSSQRVGIDPLGFF